MKTFLQNWAIGFGFTLSVGVVIYLAIAFVLWSLPVPDWFLVRVWVLVSLVLSLLVAADIRTDLKET